MTISNYSHKSYVFSKANILILTTHYSRGDYEFILGGTIIIWSSKKQSLVFVLLSEEKYATLAATTSNTLWLCKVFKNYDILKLEKILIYESSYNIIAIAKYPPTIVV